MQIKPGCSVDVPREVHLFLPNNVGRDRVADLGAVVDPARLFCAAHYVGVLNGLNRGRISGRKSVALGAVFKRGIGDVERLRFYRSIRIESSVVIGECAALLPDDDARIQ